MAKKKTNISKEEFLEYLKTEKGKSRQKVEKASLSDPFLEEAMEGYEQFPEPLAGIKELDQRIRPDRSFRIIGVAASLLLLITLGGVWIMQLSEESGVVASSETQKESVDVLSDSVSLSMNKDKSVDQLHGIDSDAIVRQKKTSQEQHVEDEKPQNIPAEEKEEAFKTEGNLGPIVARSTDEGLSESLGEEVLDREDDKLAPVKPSSIEMKKDEALTEKSVAIAETEHKNARAKKSKQKISPAPSVSDSQLSSESTMRDNNAKGNAGLGWSTTTLQTAKNAFDQQKFLNALQLYQQVLASESTNQEALFYAGMSERKLGNNQKSMDYLEKVSKTSQFYFEARWNMYELSVSDPVKSRLLLEEISSEPNSYQEKAKQLLK